MAQEPDLIIEAGFSDAKLAREVQKVVDKYKAAGEGGRESVSGFHRQGRGKPGAQGAYARTGQAAARL